jgi:rhodanese-related sulfurtransferase
MRHRLVHIFLVLLMLFPAAADAASASNLNPRDAFTMLGQRRDLYLLDVRTPAEYREFRLAGARLIPIDQLPGRLSELPRDKPILVYCAVGSRSAQVVNYLARQGYPEIYNLSGGIYAWAQSGYPVLKGGP